jgi:hypothetical protein
VIPIRLVAIGVICVGAVAGLRAAYSAAYESGYNAAKLEVSREYALRVSQAVEKEKAKWEKLTELANESKKREVEIVEVERIIEKEIPVVVEKIVQVKPECNDLGSDFIRLLNRQVSAITE